MGFTMFYHCYCYLSLNYPWLPPNPPYQWSTRSCSHVGPERNWRIETYQKKYPQKEGSLWVCSSHSSQLSAIISSRTQPSHSLAPDPKGQRIERVPPPRRFSENGGTHGNPTSENVNFEWENQWMIRGILILRPKLTCLPVHPFQREALCL